MNGHMLKYLIATVGFSALFLNGVCHEKQTKPALQQSTTPTAKPAKTRQYKIFSPTIIHSPVTKTTTHNYTPRKRNWTSPTNWTSPRARNWNLPENLTLNLNEGRGYGYQPMMYPQVQPMIYPQNQGMMYPQVQPMIYPQNQMMYPQVQPWVPAQTWTSPQAPYIVGAPGQYHNGSDNAVNNMIASGVGAFAGAALGSSLANSNNQQAPAQPTVILQSPPQSTLPPPPPPPIDETINNNYGPDTGDVDNNYGNGGYPNGGYSGAPGGPGPYDEGIPPPDNDSGNMPPPPGSPDGSTTYPAY